LLLLVLLRGVAELAPVGACGSGVRSLLLAAGAAATNEVADEWRPAAASAAVAGQRPVMWTRWTS